MHRGLLPRGRSPTASWTQTTLDSRTQLRVRGDVPAGAGSHVLLYNFRVIECAAMEKSRPGLRRESSSTMGLLTTRDLSCRCVKSACHPLCSAACTVRHHSLTYSWRWVAGADTSTHAALETPALTLTALLTPISSPTRKTRSWRWHKQPVPRNTPKRLPSCLPSVCSRSAQVQVQVQVQARLTSKVHGNADSDEAVCCPVAMWKRMQARLLRRC